MAVGLALSGGGIKSYAQIPVLEYLENNKVEIDVIAGTSMGSAIAALVACGFDVNTIYDLAFQIESMMVDSKLFLKPSPKILPFTKDRLQGGYVDGLIFEEIFNDILKDTDIVSIKDVKIPLAIPSVDLKSGKVVVFVSHPHLFKADPSWDVISDISLAKAVRASCTFPLVVAACELDDYMLADGGIKMNLPAPLLKAYGADEVIAVTMTQGAGFDEFDSILAMGNRVYDLMVESYDDLMGNQIDLNINIPVGDVWVFEMGKGKEVIDESINVVHEYQDEIQKLKKQSKLSKIWGGLK